MQYTPSVSDAHAQNILALRELSGSQNNLPKKQWQIEFILQVLTLRNIVAG